MSYSNRFENISYQLVLALANKGCKRHSERHIYMQIEKARSQKNSISSIL